MLGVPMSVVFTNDDPVKCPVKDPAPDVLFPASNSDPQTTSLIISEANSKPISPG